MISENTRDHILNRSPSHNVIKEMDELEARILSPAAENPGHQQGCKSGIRKHNRVNKKHYEPMRLGARNLIVLILSRAETQAINKDGYRA